MAALTPKALARDWTQGRYLPAYYFFGEDDGAKLLAAKNLRERLKVDDFNFSEVEADTEAHAAANVFLRYIKCYNVNERTIEASERLARAKSILREHGNYRYLNGSGSIVKLNNGIEFAMIYFAMLLALIVVGGGRYLSADYYLSLIFKRRE